MRGHREDEQTNDEQTMAAHGGCSRSHTSVAAAARCHHQRVHVKQIKKVREVGRKVQKY
jgi:hypothetical protein